MNRPVKQIYKSNQVIEGAGVKLKHVFGQPHVPRFDPFLLLDHFGSEKPEDYIKGFPWHPHRGIETVTYMLNGEVEHGDNVGNRGVIRSGDLQWMTAGSGIIHQEMPKRYDGLMQGFQLWVNLPAKQKMTAPRYRGITKDQIPILDTEGATVEVIAGTIDGVVGPIHDLVVNVEYFDIELETATTFEHPTRRSYTVFVYVLNGSAYIHDVIIKSGYCAVFGDGDSITLKTKESLRFLLIAGEPLNEPVAWRGPIVMNTETELAIAFQELENGTFIKTDRAVNPSMDVYQS